MPTPSGESQYIVSNISHIVHTLFTADLHFTPRFSALVQTIPGALPASYTYNWYRVIHGNKAAGAWR
jgi:hypothetical protein